MMVPYAVGIVDVDVFVDVFVCSYHVDVVVVVDVDVVVDGFDCCCHSLAVGAMIVVALLLLCWNLYCNGSEWRPLIACCGCVVRPFLLY